MADKRSTDWLAAWIEENMEGLQGAGEAPELEEQVLTCRADAERAGIPIDMLDQAAGGDLGLYLERVRDYLIGGEMRRAGETEMP